MTTTQARPFTNSDWNGSAGCERWTRGFETDEPVLREFEGEASTLVIADKNGVECYRIVPDSDDAIEARLNLAFPTQKAAMAFLNGLPEDFDPAEYGFRRM